ncbi:MAG: hypothetical protein AAGU05_02975 [Anaerolineaceae bacterium]
MEQPDQYTAPEATGVQADELPGLQSNTQMDVNMVKASLENLRLEQNLALGIVGGVLGGLVGAVLWVVITVLTKYQIGWMAIGVGFLVGYGNRLLGRGLDNLYAIVGGAIALVSVLLGNFLVSMAMLADAAGISYVEVFFQFNYAYTFDLMKETFSVMDLLFYGLAVVTAYKNSFRKVTKDMLLQSAVSKA